MRNAEPEVWKLIFQASHNLKEYALGIIGVEKTAHITVAQERVLAVVFSSPDGIILKDIAAELHLTPGAVSQTIDSMVRDGILERIASPHDRRAVSIIPSARMMEYKNQNADIFKKIINEAWSDVNAKEREAFVEILEKIIAKTAPHREFSRRCVRKSVSGVIAATEGEKTK